MSSIRHTVNPQSIGASLRQETLSSDDESVSIGMTMHQAEASVPAATVPTAAAALTAASVPPASSSIAREPTAEEKIKYGPLFPFNITDVKISAQEDQPTAKGRRNINTKLIGIGDVLSINMDSKQLRNWGNREKMSLRNATKAEYAVAIVNFTEQHRRMQQHGRDTTQPESIYARSKINNVRFINVLSHDPIKAAFVNRGQQITRADLDNGVRADERLWRDFATTYNRRDGTFDTLKYDVAWAGPTPDPSSFHPIDWKKAQSAYKDISKKYDMAHKKWKASGWHEDFSAPNLPFADFARQQWLVYLHEFIQQNPGILDTITSDLAEGTHFESSTGLTDDEGSNLTNTTPAAAASAQRGRKRKKSSDDDRNNIFRSIADSAKASAVSNAQKSQAIQLAAMAQTRSTMQSMLESAKEKKKTAITNLKKHPFSRQDNSRIRIMTNHLRKREVEKNATVGERLDDDETFPLSQETTNSIRLLDSFDTVYGYAKDFNDANQQIKTCEKDLKSLMTESSSSLSPTTRQSTLSGTTSSSLSS